MLKWIATLLVDILILHHYGSNLAHISDFYSFVILLQKFERWAKNNLQIRGYYSYLRNFITLKKFCLENVWSKSTEYLTVFSFELMF